MSSEGWPSPENFALLDLQLGRIQKQQPLETACTQKQTGRYWAEDLQLDSTISSPQSPLASTTPAQRHSCAAWPEALYYPPSCAFSINFQTYSPDETSHHLPNPKIHATTSTSSKETGCKETEVLASGSVNMENCESMKSLGCFNFTKLRVRFDIPPYDPPFPWWEDGLELGSLFRVRGSTHKESLQFEFCPCKYQTVLLIVTIWSSHKRSI